MKNQAITVHPEDVWLPRLLTFLLAALTSGSLVAWSLKVHSLHSESSIAATVTENQNGISSDAVAKALGAISKTPLVPAKDSSRFALIGVVAHTNAFGAVLMSVDGAPPKPYAVGESVTDDWTLQAVQERKATLARNGIEVNLELPAPPSASLAMVVLSPMLKPASTPQAAPPVVQVQKPAPAMSMAAAVAAAQHVAKETTESIAASPAIAVKGKR